MNIPIEDTIIANIVKRAPETSIAISSDLSITWLENVGLWVVYWKPQTEQSGVRLIFSGKTISEVVEFLVKNHYLPDVSFGQKHIDSGIKVQPMPVPNSEPALWDKAKEHFWNWAKVKNVNPKIVDSITKKMTDRDNYGFEKYGTRLQPFNGRDFRSDAIDELLDAIVYLEGMQIEFQSTPK